MMHDEAEVRIIKRISTNELERRWKAVRLAMADKKIDFLLIQNSTDYFGGYVKWFTDMPAVHQYPVSVIFPRDDQMTTVWHGTRAPAEPTPPAWVLRGVKKRISIPLLPVLDYTSHWDAEKVVEELAPFGKCRIGFVNLGSMSASFYKYVTGHLTSAEFENATDWVDEIKAIKSEEEIQLIRETCQIQDAAFKDILPRIQPGRRDFEIFGQVKAKCMEMGSTQQLVIGGSFPYGTRGRLFDSFLGNRMIKEGDQFNLLIESNGPSGFYAHLFSVFCIGRVSPELQEQFGVAQEAQRLILKLLKPGADPIDLWNANNDFLNSRGFEKEGRLFAHGQGYDLVERPSLNPGETIKIQANMNIAVHPCAISQKAYVQVCENYLVPKSGPPECLHETPQKIHVI
jgi:Xaa-Pro aminopeptidase